MATENLFTPGKVRLYSGKYINVVEMTEDDICLEDIAHALALKCRWNGNTKEFFSILSHTMIVQSLLLDSANSLEALLHDAHEAYLFDIPAPYKKLEPFKPLVELEEKIQHIINKKYGIETCNVPDVKQADMTALTLEWNSCMLDDRLISTHDVMYSKIKFFKLFIDCYYRRFDDTDSDIDRELRSLRCKYKF